MSKKQKRNLILLVILLVLLAIYAVRGYLAPQASDTQAPQAQGTEAPAVEVAQQPPALTVLDEDGADASAQPIEAASPDEAPEEPADADAQDMPAIAEDGTYTSRDDVALYIHTYGRLPDNFITKKEAEALGWEGGGLDDYAYGKCIGGSHYGNYEGLLPEQSGRRYTECDIDTLHRRSRGAKRIVFSNDGLVYYTDDHYDSFTLLYGEE